MDYTSISVNTYVRTNKNLTTIAEMATSACAVEINIVYPDRALFWNREVVAIKVPFQIVAICKSTIKEQLERICWFAFLAIVQSEFFVNLVIINKKRKFLILVFFASTIKKVRLGFKNNHRTRGGSCAVDEKMLMGLYLYLNSLSYNFYYIGVVTW